MNNRENDLDILEDADDFDFDTIDDDEEDNDNDGDNDSDIDRPMIGLAGPFKYEVIFISIYLLKNKHSECPKDP